MSDIDWLNALSSKYPSFAGPTPQPAAQPATAPVVAPATSPASAPVQPAQPAPTVTTPADQTTPAQPPEPKPPDPYQVVAHAITLNENPFLGPAAQNPGSSATGDGQFLKDTWLSSIRQWRPDLLQGRTEQQILDLRKDPMLSQEMVANNARDNGVALGNARVEVDPGTLYMAHALGPNGAIAALRADPNTPLGSIIGWDVLAKNPSWGRNPTVGGFRTQMTNMTQAKMAETDSIDDRLQKLIGDPPQAAPAPAAPPAPPPQQSTGFPGTPASTPPPPGGPDQNAPPPTDDVQTRLQKLIGDPPQQLPNPANQTQFHTGTSQAGTYAPGSYTDAIPQPPGVTGPPKPAPKASDAPPAPDERDPSAAIAAGWNNAPTIFTPETQKTLDDQTPVLGALGHVGNAVLGAGEAVYGGLMHGLTTDLDALYPGLGRQVGGLIESETARNMGEGSVEPGTRDPATLPEPVAPKTIVDTPKPTGAQAGAPVPPDPVAAGKAYDGMTPQEKAQVVSDRQTQPTAVRDSNGTVTTDQTNYVPGTSPTAAVREPTPDNIAKYNAVAKNDPAQSMAAAQAADDAARKAYAGTIDTSTATETALKNKRSTDAQGDLDATFKNIGPYNPTADVQPVVQHIQDTLAGPTGKRPVIAGPMQSVLDRLYQTDATGSPVLDASGNRVLETDPATLYAVKQSINDMLDRSNPSNAGNIQARSQLMEIGSRLDQAISDGVGRGQAAAMRDMADQIDAGATPPKPWQNSAQLRSAADDLENHVYPDAYTSYKNQYAENSKPINEIHALRDAGFDNLANNGPMKLSSVQKVIDNLTNGVKSGDMDALSVSGETMQKLYNLRDDLARKERVINPTTGGVKPTAMPPAAVQQDIATQMAPANKLWSMAPHAANYLLNTLVGHNTLGPLAGTIADAVVQGGMNKLRSGAVSKATQGVLNSWTNDLMQLHPDWNGAPPPAPVPVKGVFRQPPLYGGGFSGPVGEFGQSPAFGYGINPLIQQNPTNQERAN
jgi:hypothetical protein